MGFARPFVEKIAVKDRKSVEDRSTDTGPFHHKPEGRGLDDFGRFKMSLLLAIERYKGLSTHDVWRASQVVDELHGHALALLVALAEAAPEGIAFESVLSKYDPHPDLPSAARELGLGGRPWEEDRATLLALLIKLRDATAAVLTGGGLRVYQGCRRRPWDAEELIEGVCGVFLEWYRKPRKGPGATFQRDLTRVVKLALRYTGKSLPASVDPGALTGVRPRFWRDYIAPALERARCARACPIPALCLDNRKKTDESPH